LTLLAVALLPAPAGARTPKIRPADEAATHAYLAAYYAYQQAVNAALPAAVGAEQALGAKIGAECSGVLANAPVRGLGGILGEEAPSGSARQQGEHARERRQLEGLTLELSLAESQAAESTLAAAETAFVGAATPLRWTNNAINAGVQLYLTRRGSELTRPINACADIRAWVASGYRSLPAATRELLGRLQSSFGDRRVVAISPLSVRLRPYEGVPEHALLAAIRALENGRRSSDEALQAVDRNLNAALGLPAEPEAEQMPIEHPKKGSVTLAHGRTADGERFTAVLEPRGRESGCQINISIESAGGSDGFCFGGRDNSTDRSVNCHEGRLEITSKTLPRTRSVRLLLSDNHTITSPAIFVPKRLGGPIGVYYQVVRGPSPIPVSLTELDAHGRALRVVRLPAVVECTRNPLKYLPGGLRTLARVTVPNGPTFTLVAEHYRFLGQTYFDIKAEQVSDTPHLFGAEGSSGATIGLGGHRSLAERLLTLEGEQSGCEPTPYTLLFGVLKPSRDTVLARAGGRLSPLRKIQLPKQLDTPGALVYGVVEPPPEALVIRAPGGRTVATERVYGSHQTVEQCEGEAEPATPAPAQASG
jgi:hypothetical protein